MNQQNSEIYLTGSEDNTTACGVSAANTLTRSFEYDPLYRLLQATGRESGQYSNSATPWGESGYIPTYPPSGGTNTPANTRAYQRNYTYDRLGNLLKLEHDAGAGASFNHYFNDYGTALVIADQVAFDGVSGYPKHFRNPLLAAAFQR